MNDLRQSSGWKGINPLALLKRPSVARWAPIPLRLIVGYGFMEHGYAKLFKGPEVFAAMLHRIGVPAPHFMAWLTILTEASEVSQSCSELSLPWLVCRWRRFSS